MSSAASVRIGTTSDERDELREVMAILHRVKLRLAVIGHTSGVALPTEARLLDEALDRIGEVVRPGSVRRV